MADIKIRFGRGDPDEYYWLDDENPIVALDAVHVQLTGLENNYEWVDDENAQTHAESVYYVLADGPQTNGDPDPRSHLFAPSADGTHEWDGFVFPYAGSWTVKVMRRPQGNESGDQQIATESVTVEPAS